MRAYSPPKLQVVIVNTVGVVGAVTAALGNWEVCTQVQPEVAPLQVTDNEKLPRELNTPVTQMK